jgi:capsular polysaccharide biosynthesis protein
MEYQQMLDRTSSALLDLDNARAGFKYRYDVVWPAQVPRKPVSPSITKVFGLGIPGAIGLALLATALLALRSGTIIVDWQVEKSLDLPILGRVRR